ncbi:hypothetical protein F5878DRAFT_655872 [Lentinula raphanica]|uniref:Uncharacterized protein n=1 Tax=Lentinula raphanica TaxID=153919 RepID=A0AA38UKC2_9AGAR|nr:hypothetical protein F5878DRAFT_655872 [Lentinula raphanica]
MSVFHIPEPEESSSRSRSGRTIKTPKRLPQLVGGSVASSGSSESPDSKVSRTSSSSKSTSIRPRKTRVKARTGNHDGKLPVLPDVPIYPRDRIYDAYDTFDWDRFESCPFGKDDSLKIGDYVQFHHEIDSSPLVGTFRGCVIDIRAQQWISSSMKVEQPQNYRILASTLFSKPHPDNIVTDQRMMDNVRRRGEGNRQVFATSMAVWVQPAEILKKELITMIKTHDVPPRSGVFFDHIYFVGSTDESPSFLIPAITSNDIALWPLKMVGIHDWSGHSRTQASSSLRYWNEEIFDLYDPMAGGSAAAGSPTPGLQAGSSVTVRPSPRLSEVADEALVLGKRSQRIQDSDSNSLAINTSRTKRKRESTLTPTPSSDVVTPHRFGTLDLAGQNQRGVILTPGNGLSTLSLSALNNDSTPSANNLRVLQLGSLDHHQNDRMMSIDDCDKTIDSIDRESSAQINIKFDFDLVYPETFRPTSFSPSPSSRRKSDDTMTVKPEVENRVLPKPSASTDVVLDDHFGGIVSRDGRHRQIQLAPALSPLNMSTSLFETTASAQNVTEAAMISSLTHRHPSSSCSSSTMDPTSAVDLAVRFQGSNTRHLENDLRSQVGSALGSSSSNIHYLSMHAREQSFKIQELEKQLESRLSELREKSAEHETMSSEIAKLQGKLEEMIDESDAVCKERNTAFEERDSAFEERDNAFAERDRALQATNQLKAQLQEYREYFRLQSKLSVE